MALIGGSAKKCGEASVRGGMGYRANVALPPAERSV